MRWLPPTRCVVLAFCSALCGPACEGGGENQDEPDEGPRPAGKADGVAVDCSEFSFDLSPPATELEFSFSSLLPSDAVGPGRNTPSAAFDTARDRLVAFDPRSGTWEWNAFDAWVLRSDLSTGPQTDPRAEQVRLAYDRSRQRTMLFGGPDATVWEWDGTSWSEVEVEGPTPLARTYSALAYDDDREVIWMFGGQALDGTRLRDLWSWDGVAWEQHTFEGPTPSARRGHQIAYDSLRGRLVLHGGLDDSATWEWDGTEWDAVAARPPVASSGGLVFDSQHGEILLIGQRTSRTQAEDTPWVWDGEGWSRAAARRLPRRRTTSGVVYDPLRGRTLLLQPRFTLGSLAQLVRGSATNRAPSITVSAAPPKRLWPGDPFEVQLTGQDPDGHRVQLEAGTLPEGATFDAASGALVWTPTPDQVGAQALSVGASDGEFCSVVHFDVDVVDPAYPDLPVGEYALYRQLISIPSKFVERFSHFGRLRSREYEVPNTGVLCSLFGENPGKLTIVCETRAVISRRGPPYSVATFRGKSTVEPDGSFSLSIAVLGASPPSHPSYVPSLGSVGAAVQPDCPFLRGHLEWVGEGRIDVNIQRLDARCPMSPTEDGVVGPLPGTSSRVRIEFRGFAYDPAVVAPTSAGDGVGLGTATFWQSEQERMRTVAGPFWREWSGGVYAMDGTLLATSGDGVPTLIPAILDIYRDEDGALVVVQ